MKLWEEFVYARSLIEASLDPLIAINANGKITDMNQATIKIIGMSRKAITGTNFCGYFTDPQKAGEVYKEAFATGFVSNASLILRHQKGTLTEVMFNGSVYYDDQGIAQGVVIAARDVTEQKKMLKMPFMPNCLLNLALKLQKKPE